MTTRNKEILKAAHELEYPENVPYFVNGAEWADKHPSKESLRPHNRWKPSEEQMKVFLKALHNNVGLLHDEQNTFRQLYEQLKAL